LRNIGPAPIKRKTTSGLTVQLVIIEPRGDVNN
jgi:hypothetical protein